MLTKKDIFRFLEENGIKHNDKVVIHASLRSIGSIENGADGLIDAMCEYLRSLPEDRAVTLIHLRKHRFVGQALFAGKF